MIKHIAIICLLIAFTSCKTLSLHPESHKLTVQKITLGSVGLDKIFLLDNTYSGTAVPEYKSPIKVSVLPVQFSKKTYKAFINAKSKQSAGVNINYIDSLSVKPVFLTLNIVDKVVLVNTLNESNNTPVKDYMAVQEGAKVVTGISIALDQNTQNNILQSEAVFLVQNGLKQQSIQLYNDGKVTQSIPFNTGVIFAFNSSSCCWQENDKFKVNIVDIVSTTLDCPKQTYNSAKQAKKKINYFKL